jgi:predicted lipid-binding transport protein (Tim44 family)
MERRSVAAGPSRVTAALRATAGAAHERVTVRVPPGGTTVATEVELGTTVPAAWPTAGSASSAVTRENSVSRRSITHATTGSRLAPPSYAARSMGSLSLFLAQAGSGSGGFGGGGGGGGGGSGFGGGSSGTGEGEPFVAVVVFGLFGLFLLYLVIHTVRYRRRLRERDARVRTASAEAAEDDAYFASDELERHAVALFRAAQLAWDARDREALARLVGPDLLVEWNRRLDDFDQKGWHNRVEVLEDPVVHYVGITNREDDSEDRAVVRIEAKLRAYVLDRSGTRVMRSGEKDELVTLAEYWSLARRDGAWSVQSIEQRAEGDHHLEGQIVASPWSDEQRLDDESLTELAVADGLPEGFTTADLAEVGFEGDARARALDLSVADARFGPDVLEAAARRAVAAWAEAVDGDDAVLERVASEEAATELLYGGDPARRTRVVVRGPRVRTIRVANLQVDHSPATVEVDVELGGRRYVEDRDTAAVVSGARDRAATFAMRWTLALDGPDDSPWRLVRAA